jgi:hypothetical protein
LKLTETWFYNTRMGWSWRKSLPPLQFTAYILLVWYGCWYRPTWQEWFKNWVSPSSQSTDFYPGWIDGIDPLPEQLAAGLNFPAVVAASLSLAPFRAGFRMGASEDLAMHVVTAIYVPLLWFVIGWWIDARELRKPVPLSSRRKAVAVVALAGLSLATWVMLWAFPEGPRYPMAVLSLAWVLSGIVAICLHLRRLRRSRRFKPERNLN